MKTDIYNPLGLAADAAREGDFTKVAMYVENIADVFFPLDGGEDPVWPNAANNAFKRAAYGLIDYYLEEEKELRRKADRTGMDEKVLDTKLDEMWGKVTLYNTYQLFVQLTSKKIKNPAVEFAAQAKAGAFENLPDEEYAAKLAEVEQQSKLWEDKPEVDLLTLYFNATGALPMNSMRRLVNNANNALRSMGAAEKMLASVYGIAITAMSFFTDPTISTLTSGTPSQNADLPGMSFPRCLGVRFHPDFLVKYHLIGMQARWSSYADKDFTKNLGKDFYHEDLVSREGWAKYYFKGKYERDIAYAKLEIVNPQTDMLIRTFYFQFRKSYQTSLDARYYVKDPVLGDKIVKNGVLVEVRRFKKKDGTIVFKKAKTAFEQEKIVDVLSSTRRERVKTAAITQTLVRYSEKPKMVFLVTPPHLMKYAKLILILLKQLVDLNFDKSYMTKSNQKPLYKTRFMLDELGNLQSEGHGISGFETMLSIGLGQEQQFTLILQTLQQLRDVYGESVDKIVQGNTSNIVFLKSTDDSMLDTLQKMSGTTHRAFRDSKTVTQDKERLFMQNKGEVTYTVSVKEVPVITYNDMAFLSERNSIVFRASDSPVWNRNETILPMSWRLFKNTITHAGHDYTLQTIPTLSSALDFDVRKNQPDFVEMLNKRVAQANVSEEAQKKYREAYNYSDYEMSQLDPDVYSDEVMLVINEKIRRKAKEESMMVDDDDDYIPDSVAEQFKVSDIEDNTDVIDAMAESQQKMEEWSRKVYAGRMLSKEDLVSMTTGPNHQFDADIIACYQELRGVMSKSTQYFTVHTNDKGLYGLHGEQYIIESKDRTLQQMYEEDAKDPNKRVFSGIDESSMTPEQKRQFDKEKQMFAGFQVTDEFYRFLVSIDRWDFANGRFETEMARRINTR